MSTPSFAPILDRPASEIERPKPIPAGTYTALVKGLPEFGESSQKKTPYARFTFELIAAGDDIDQEALEEMGGIGGKTLRNDYYLTEDALWRIKQFAEDCGVDPEGLTVGQMLEYANGAQVQVVVRHEPARDGSDNIFARVAKTAPVA